LEFNEKVTKMKVLILSVLILITLNLQSQTIQLTDLDSATATADRLIETNPRIFFKNVECFIVSYDGQTRKDLLHHIQSQTKSIVSLLLGIAIDKGFVQGEDELVSICFPGYFTSAGSVKSDLTIKDILTMSAGFEWEEMIPLDDPENDNINMFNSRDYLKYILSKPVSDSLYVHFNYNSGCPMIIAGIIEKAAQMRLDRFAEKYLLEPLGITDYRWIKDSTGFCHAGGGLYMKPADMVKIGLLVMNQGMWKNQQIISENRIRKIIHPCIAANFGEREYGYFWRINKYALNQGRTVTVVSAEGAGGQKLYIFPDYKLVVAFTERNYTTPQVSPLFIRESILPLLN
jgi:CubicO group peptidase (beta-lactamase class C family)